MQATGLSSAEAAARLEAEGPNRLEERAGRGVRGMLVDQLRNPFVLLLGGAAALAFALGEQVDAIAIAVIVVLNAAVGTVQEWRAERALQALKSMTAPRAHVLRDGQVEVVPAESVVRGDLLVLEAGDVVAADARLVQAHALSTIEASLTGESLPVDKSTARVPDDAPRVVVGPLGERTDRVFAGTSVAAGTGRAEVVATGMDTEIGRIARMLGEARNVQTPLQARLARVSRSLLVLCVFVVGIVAAVGLARGQDWLDVLLVAVALAVAAVPEGLPAVVTIALAVGVRRMAARHVLVRQLPAVETLGSTTVICTDKTGTLTTGQMRVRQLRTAEAVTERRLLEAAAACCDAELRGPHGGVGDPTEIAILLAARNGGVERPGIEQEWPRLTEIPFDSERKRMAVVRRVAGVDRIFVKGALGSVAPLCPRGWDEAEAVEQRLAAEGLRVLAVAEGYGRREADLRLLGLLGIADPPRASAVAAIDAARRAGIRTIMLTGDHRVTAIAIARELGLLRSGDNPDVLVHARVTPADKLDVVRELSAQGEIVAMTGDGVNDAPAIREAHVGIAMGITGTEVTREAASVVLADDHFASIVEGVREGRTIYQNIQKTVTYLVAGNAAELVIVLSATLLGLPPPLLPVHLLWINLVTDGFPALALVVDPPDRDAMSVPPRDPAEPMLGRGAWGLIALSAIIEAGVVLAVYAWALDHDPAHAQTLAFSTLVVSELFRVFAFRSRARVLPEVGVFTNLPLLAVIVVSLAVQFALTEVALAREVFHLQSVPMLGWGVVVGAALVPVSVLEIGKLLWRWRLPSAQAEPAGRP
jgi:P-type Ca2+ transporter type 2C